MRCLDALVMVTSHRIINVSTDSADPTRAASDATFRVASELWSVFLGCSDRGYLTVVFNGRPLHHSYRVPGAVCVFASLNSVHVAVLRRLSHR